MVGEVGASEMSVARGSKGYANWVELQMPELSFW